MFHIIFKKYFKPGTIHIFVFSFLVFIVLNVIENVNHYNIGKFHEGNGDTKKENDRRTNISGYHFTNPSNTDCVRIVIIMVIFAILQGFFTSYFSVC